VTATYVKKGQGEPPINQFGGMSWNSTRKKMLSI
jgi:hypothetical protein